MRLAVVAIIAKALTAARAEAEAERDAARAERDEWASRSLSANPEQWEVNIRLAAKAEGAREALAQAIAAVRSERLEDPQPDTGDVAYEQALDDALAALERLRTRAAADTGAR